MMLSDWFRKGVKGIQQLLQKTLFTRIWAGTPIKGYIQRKKRCVSIMEQVVNMGYAGRDTLPA
jgi:hypothetical protein